MRKWRGEDEGIKNGRQYDATLSLSTSLCPYSSVRIQRRITGKGNERKQKGRKKKLGEREGRKMEKEEYDVTFTLFLLLLSPSTKREK